MWLLARIAPTSPLETGLNLDGDPDCKRKYTRLDGRVTLDQIGFGTHVPPVVHG
jgi:hypothetical protein